MTITMVLMWIGQCKMDIDKGEIMAFRVKETDVDGRESTFVEESYEDEIAQAFLNADREHGQEVDVIYVIDDITGESIELWRHQWMIEKIQ